VLDDPAIDYVHRAAKQSLKLVAHFLAVCQQVSLRSEFYQHVDVAVGAEIVAQDRAEQRKLGDMSVLAEGRDLVHRQIDPD
jgi:hypothetical protein